MTDFEYKEKQRPYLEHKILDKEEEYELFLGSREGKRMIDRDLLFEYNERMAFALAEEFEKRIMGLVSFQDLHQEARLILLELIDKHDYNKGKFSTYFYNSASRLMERRLYDYLYPGKLSKRISNYLPQVNHIIETLRQELKREPTEVDFLSCEKMKNIFKRKDKNGQPILRKNEALIAFNIEAGYASLDCVAEDSGGLSMGDLIQGDASAFDRDLIDFEQASDYYCSFLNKNQSYVFKEYMMADRPSRVVADELGISHQRVSQIKDEVKNILKKEIL